MARYFLLPNARLHFANIYAYTIENFGYTQWQKYSALLESEFQNIADNPTLGSQSNIPFKHIKNGVHKVIAGGNKRDRNHYICYRKNPTTGNIDIIAIIHTSRDLYRDLSQIPVKEYQEPKPTKHLSPYEKRKLAKQQNKGKNKFRGW